MGSLGEARGLSKLILFGEASLRRALTEYTEHYHTERNHQGKEDELLLPGRASVGSGPRRHVMSILAVRHLRFGIPEEPQSARAHPH